MPDRQIKIGDIVYQKKRGWSGVPMEVVELIQVTSRHGMVTQALCKGAQGWSVNGLYSSKYGIRVEHYSLEYLTHTPNSAIGGNAGRQARTL